MGSREKNVELRICHGPGLLPVYNEGVLEAKLQRDTEIKDRQNPAL